MFRAPDSCYSDHKQGSYMNWVFSLFNLEFTKEDFLLSFFQWECYEDEGYMQLETVDAVFHLSCGKEFLLLHIMGFDVIVLGD